MLFPLVMTLVCVGCGQVLARAAGVSVPAALVPPLGFAVVVVCSTFTTAFPATAPLTTSVVAGLGAAGLCLLPRRRPRRAVGAAAIVAVVVFLAYGAPVLASGSPTFAGYVKLDDTATFLALVDHALTHGRDLGGLPPSTHEATLAVNLANGYPLGALTPLGVGARLVGTDLAWGWQPYLSFVAALLGLALFGLAGRLGLRLRAQVAAAVVGAQPALLYAYALWGGVKELVAAALLALAAALVTAAELSPRLSPRRLLPLAMASAALLGATSLAAGLWLVPIIGATVIAARPSAIRRTAMLVLLIALLALPTLVDARGFLRRDNVTSFRADEELGNLVGRLPSRQVLGVWPTGDFRVEPDHSSLTWLLVGIAASGLAAGLLHATKVRSFAVLGLFAAAGLGIAVFALSSSPWVEGKALAIASPVALFIAASGYLALQRDLRRVGAAGLALLTAGVLWSNVLAYREAWLAPFDQLRELEHIGERFNGRGPTLMTEYQPYGVRHFLRHLDAEGASELRRRPVFLANGAMLSKGAFADIDELALADVRATYRLLVLRRSPVASRPPGGYELALRGAWYDVWARDDSRPAPIEHLSLGSPLDPIGTAPCAQVRALAARAGAAGKVVSPARGATAVAGIGTPLPPGWVSAGAGIVEPTREGTAGVVVSVPAAGTYSLWVGGSFHGVLRARIGEVQLGSASAQLNPDGMWTRLGSTRLEAGPQHVTLELHRSAARPASAGRGLVLGPVALAQESTAALRILPTAAASRLCATRLDWLEARIG